MILAHQQWLLVEAGHNDHYIIAAKGRHFLNHVSQINHAFNIPGFPGGSVVKNHLPLWGGWGLPRWQ